MSKVDKKDSDADAVFYAKWKDSKIEVSEAGHNAVRACYMAGKTGTSAETLTMMLGCTDGPQTGKTFREWICAERERDRKGRQPYYDELLSMYGGVLQRAILQGLIKVLP